MDNLVTKLEKYADEEYSSFLELLNMEKVVKFHLYNKKTRCEIIEKCDEYYVVYDLTKSMMLQLANEIKELAESMEE